MIQDVKIFVKNCAICQKAMSEYTHSKGLLQPLQITQQIWEEISMDFITSLLMSKRFIIIFVVVDRLSKSRHFTPLKSNFSSIVVAEAFIKNVVKLNGIPKSIVIYNDNVFLSNF